MKRYRLKGFSLLSHRSIGSASGPKTYISERRVEITSEMHNKRWYMNRHDPDILCPSCPHCHAHDSNWKLNIYTREIYDEVSKRIVGKITKREHMDMWTQKRFLSAVLEERKWYNETYHSQDPRRYPELPAFPSFITDKRKREQARIVSKLHKRPLCVKRIK